MTDPETSGTRDPPNITQSTKQFDKHTQNSVVTSGERSGKSSATGEDQDMTDVLIAGVAVADIIMRVAELPEKAEKYRAKDALVTVGGCAANAAIAVARQGGRARLAARLGDDLIGHLIADGIKAEGVDLSLSDRREGAQSSFSSLYVDAAGERQIMNFRGRDLAETIDLTSAPPAGAVLADNRWPKLTAEAIATARRWSRWWKRSTREVSRV